MSENTEVVIDAAAAHRKKSVRKNTIGVFTLRGVSMATTYFMIPLLVKYLNTYQYGIWLTIFSFLSWFQFLDIGLGNGLRNKYGHSIALGDNSLARTYVSTTYYIIMIITIILIVAFGVTFPFINWHKAFNVDPARFGSELNWLVFFVFGSAALNFPLKVINALFYGSQKSAFANTMGCITNVASLVIIYLVINKSGEDNLLIVGFTYTIIPLILMLGLNIYFFSTSFKDVRPSLKFVNKKYIKDLTGSGVKFFILQINNLLLLSTNSIIIAKTLGQVKVTEYNIMFKLYNIPYVVCQIMTTPYWGAFTNAYAKKDFKWIKKNLNILIKLLIGISLLAVMIFIFNKPIFKLWVGSKVSVNTLSGLYFVVYIILLAGALPFASFINSTGKIKLQLIVTTVNTIVNIPLSVYLIQHYNMGIDGTILASIICTIPVFIFTIVQTYKIVNGTAKGIWNAS